MTIKTIRLRKNMGLINRSDREVKVAIIIISLFTAGMIIGAGIMRITPTFPDTNEFISIFNAFIQKRNELNVYNIFISSVVADSVTIIVAFVFGLHCFGLPVISLLPFIRGLGFGMLSGYLMTYYRINGVGYYLLTIFPSGVITAVVLILACTTAIISSCDLLAVVLGKKQIEAKNLFNYVKKFALFLLITVLAGFADGILSKSFSYLFVF